MEFWLIIGLIAAAVLLAVVIFLIYRLFVAFQVVPQEQRLVIYRLGRFHRLAGPGPVQLLRGVDSVMQTLEVRDHPLEITVSGVFAFGVPNDLTLNLWCSVDLAQAAGGDKNRLAKMVQLREGERHHQVEVKMRDALIHQISELQKRMPLPPNASTLDGVIALAPGSERYNALLDGITGELEHTLPSVGVILNTTQPITLTRRGIPEAIITAIQRRYGRDIDSQWLTKYAGALQQDFPDVPRAVLAQVLAAIEGVDAGRVQRLLFEQEGTGVEADVEFELPGDSGARPNVVTKPRARPRDTGAGRQTAPPRYQDVPAQSTSARLSESDLAVLKRVPRSDGAERLSA